MGQFKSMTHMKKILPYVLLLFIAACQDDGNGASKETSDSNAHTAVQSSQARNDASRSEASDQPIVASPLTPFKVLSLSEGVYDDTFALQLNFNLPLHADQDLDALIELQAGDQAVEPHWIISANRMAVYNPFIDRDTWYQVSVAAELRSQNDKRLGEAVKKKVKTGPMPDVVRFVSRGNTLLSSDQGLPIEAVNVAAVDLKFWRIRADHLHEFLRNPEMQNIYSLQGLNRMADLVYSAQYTLDGVKNKTEQHVLPIASIDEIKPSGVYFVSMIPAGDYPYEHQTSWFLQTDIGLHTRQYDQGLAVFAHRLPEATPYADVEVFLYNHKGELQSQARTDSEGLARLQADQRQHMSFLLAQHSDAVQLVRLNQAHLDLTDFKLAARGHRDFELFIYGPRDLYRPGETVQYSALLRDDDGELVPAAPLAVEIRRPDNRVFKSFSWLGDAQSFYTTEFTLPRDAMTGRWRLTAQLPDKSVFSHEISVEDFLPERLKLEIKPQHTHLSMSETPVIDVQSDYLYGAPAAGNRYDATVNMRAATRLFDDYTDYSFGSNHYGDFDTTFTQDAAQLNDAGFAQLKLSSHWNSARFPLQLLTHVNVYESGGRPITRSTTQYLWPAEYAVGIKPQWDGEFANPNRNNGVSLVALNRAGELVDLAGAEVTLVQESRDRYWHWGNDGWRYRNSDNEVLVYSAVQDIGAGGDTALQLPLNYGQYRLEVRDAQQNLLSSMRFFAGWRWYDPYAHSGEKPDAVKLAWQGDALKAGEKARLLITAPFAGQALITLESDRLLWHTQIRMDAPEVEIDVPIDAQWTRHDLHATAMVVKPGRMQIGHLPRRALGVIHAPLQRDQRRIQLQLEHPQKTLPDQPVTVVIKADNLQGEGPTQVTLAAVDTGVLNISGFKTPMPHAWFFAPRAHSPQLRDVYGSLIDWIEGKQARQKFGGDADISRGGEAPQSEVQIVSILSDKVTLDDQGEARIELPLPYFNGELRLMALAFNARQFAGAESRLTVAAPIVVEASLPRFLARGDDTTATIEVLNSEDEKVDIELEFSADEVLGGHSETLEFSLDAEQKRIVQLPLQGRGHRGLGAIKVHTRASLAGGFELTRSWRLGLRPAFPAVVDVHKGILDAGGRFASPVSHYDKFDPANLKAVLKLSDTPVLNREDQLLQLLRYPYGCLEQTTSSAWPLLSADASDFALFEQASQRRLFDDRRRAVEDAIGRLLGMQLHSGGFGLWSNGDYEEHWLTVYVTDFLITARNLGYAVPEAPLNKAIQRLGVYVRNPASIRSDLAQYLSHRNHFEIAYKAYAASVLSGIGKVGLQDVRRLYGEFADQAKSPLPLAHLATALEKLGDPDRALSAWQRAVDFKADRMSQDYYGDYGSTIRDLAAMVTLSVDSAVAGQSPNTPMQRIADIQDAVASRNWLSTQERNALFLAEKALRAARKDGDPWRVNLDIGGEAQTLESVGELTRVWTERGAQDEINVENTAEATVFVDLRYQGFLQEHRQESHGVVVRKRFFDLNGKALDLNDLKSGDALLVHVEISLDEAHNYLPHAMLIDLLPAGLELENQNLEHAMKLDDLRVDGRTVSDWGGHTVVRHSEYRDDRFVAALALSSYNNAHVFYLARAVTPGRYVIPPSLVEDMYRPEIRGTSDDLGVLKVAAPERP